MVAEQVPKRPRPLTAERLVETLAKAHTELAIQMLADICGDPEQPAAARVAAASHLLDRGWGKPRQDISIGGGDDFSGLSDAELIAELAAIGEAAPADQGGVAPPGDPGKFH